MKLCRFALLEDPEIARSGIYHEERVYEVEGRNARGIHDLASVRFLAPIQRPGSIRLFDPVPNGMRFDYLNAGAFLGTGSEIDAGGRPLALEVRLGVVVQDAGVDFAIDEAEQAVLGIAACLTFRRENADPVVARDMPVVAAPFVTTPNELPLPDEQGTRAFTVEIRRQAGATTVFETREGAPFSNLIGVASASCPLRAGDLLLSPPLVASGPQSGLAALIDGDRVIVRVGDLGAVACAVI